MGEDVKTDAQVATDASSTERPDPAELSDADLAQVSGGNQDIVVNKAKTAEKARAAMDAYIRG